MFPNSMFGTRYNHFEFLPCAGIFNILNSLKTRMWDQCDSISVKRQAEIYSIKVLVDREPLKKASKERSRE